MINQKKRKRHDDAKAANQRGFTNGRDASTYSNGTGYDIKTAKPSAVFSPQGGRPWTLSVALPGSIIANAQNHDAKTHLAGTIARALAVFCVDEVIIFDDGKEGPEARIPPATTQDYTAYSHPSHFLAHLLSFLETPAYLRKALLDVHQNLKTAGALPSLDMPHHLRANEWCEYREGATGQPTPSGTPVDVGLPEPYLIPDVQIPERTRVTVRLQSATDGAVMPTAEAVNPAEPRENLGYYWGYTVRRCDSLSAVLTESPFVGGYDVSIGTSERGTPLEEAFSFLRNTTTRRADKTNADATEATTTTTEESTKQSTLLNFHHLLLVFGGVTGLETAASNDRELDKLGITKKNVGELFDYWINVLPGQGSRTIRTEEALWLGLMGTRGIIERRTQHDRHQE